MTLRFRINIPGHRKLGCFISLLILTNVIFAQSPRIDSLKRKLGSSSDTARPYLLNKLSDEYLNSMDSSGIHISHDSLVAWARQTATEALSLSKKLNYSRGVGIALVKIGDLKWINSPKFLNDALSYYRDALAYFKAAHDTLDLGYCYYSMAADDHFIGSLDNSITYYDSAINIFLLLKDTATATNCLLWQGHSYFDKGDYKNAFEYETRGLAWAERMKKIPLIIFANVNLIEIFHGAGLPETALEYYHKIIALNPLSPPKNNRSTLPHSMIWGSWVAGAAYIDLKEIDSAIFIASFVPPDSTDGDSQRFYGQLYEALHQDDKALAYFVKGFELKKQIGHAIGLAGNAVELGKFYLKRKDYKSAIYYSKFGLDLATKIHALLEMKNAVAVLSDVYSRTANFQQAYHYGQLFRAYSDSLASDEYKRKISLVQIQNQLDNQKQQSLLLSKENQLKEQQLKTEQLYDKIFIAGIIGLLVVAGFIYWNYNQKKSANIQLEKQKQEIQATLKELKLTQAQLIQSEKMASLGELTAGIAHEIQNPLNFVNNFSELNEELISEMKYSVEKGNTEEALGLAENIQQNEKKISFHGKRADDIVKGMLQHSRKGQAVKELTDLNALAEEYLRLAYHGMKAKETHSPAGNSLQAKLITQFEPHLPEIELIPQDIGRVLLNLYNNAFYAIATKQKLNIADFEPLVKVSTSKKDGKYELTVFDNGTGVDPEIKDKIFQPFFTTKPTGQGVGLGLSLCYDIIVKEHQGMLRVESKPGQSTEFIIELPA